MKKRIKEISDKFMKVYKSKTLKEMVINIPWGFPEFLIFAGMFVMMLIPVYQIFSNLIGSYMQGSIWANKLESYVQDFVSLNALESYVQVITFINEKIAILAILALLLIFAKQKIEKCDRGIYLNSTVIFFGFMVIMMIVSTVVDGFNNYALCGDIYRNESIFVYVAYFAVYFYISSMIRSGRFKSLLLYAYISSSIVMAVFALIHTFSPIAPFMNPIGLALIFRNSNHYGYYMTMAVLISSVLFIKEKNIYLRIYCLISFALNTVVLIINNTFGGYLACIFGLVFSVIVLSICDKKLNGMSFVMIALFIVITLLMNIWYDTVEVSVFDFTSDIGDILKGTEEASRAGSGRWGIWTQTVKYISERPILGFGVEGISKRLGAATYYERPHCEFLQYAAFFGIPAAVLYVCGVFSVYLNGLKRRYELDIYTITALVAAFGYLVSSTFGNTTHYVSPYFFIMLGMGFSQKSACVKYL